MTAVPAHKKAPSAPSHVAIIMDGNGRWAQARGLPRTVGHRRGADAVKTALECAVKAGVGYLTLYGFSSENWNRPEDEINDLMGLLSYYLKSEIDSLDERGIQLRVIGERRRLAPDIVTMIEKAEARTAGNSALSLTIALSYGSRAEITDAARRLAEDAVAGRIDPKDINDKLFESYLFTRGIPDPDVLIRTSGEKRISNFLLWQLAYTEFVFIDTLWPDFSREDFENAIAEFHRRERRYGTTGV